MDEIRSAKGSSSPPYCEGRCLLTSSNNGFIAVSYRLGTPIMVVTERKVLLPIDSLATVDFHKHQFIYPINAKRNPAHARKNNGRRRYVLVNASSLYAFDILRSPILLGAFSQAELALSCP